MSVKHPPRTRRERAFSSLALLSAGALLTSSTLFGVSALGKDAAEMLAQLERRPAGAFTQVPTRAFLGRHPGRDVHGRGGCGPPPAWGCSAPRRSTRASTPQ